MSVEQMNSICPKCGGLMTFSSYFQHYKCGVCCHKIGVRERTINDVKKQILNILKENKCDINIITSKDTNKILLSRGDEQEIIYEE